MERQITSGLHIKFEGSHFASISYELWTYMYNIYAHDVRVGWHFS